MSFGGAIFKFSATRLVFYNSTRGLKSPIPFKWNRPEKIPCQKPERSGDLFSLMEVDKKNVFPIEYRDIEELKTAEDKVKRLFTLEYFPYNKTVEHLRNEYLKMTQRHNFDKTSEEARVAKMTADIRDMQRHMEAFPLDRKAGVRLKETIDKRKKCLKLLRQHDYKCYEWVLEKLGLVYKPQPEQDVYLRVERKRSIRMMTSELCDKIVQEKLDKLRSTFESEQIEFLEKKVDALKWIMKEEAECKIKPTVTQEDVDQTIKKLEALKLSKSKNEKQMDLDA